MKKVTLLLCSIFFLYSAKSQCREWLGEPYDSLAPFIKKIETISGFKLIKQKRGIDTLDKFISFLDSSYKLVSVKVYFDIVEKLVDNKIINVNKGLKAVEIIAPSEYVEIIYNWIGSTVAECKKLQKSNTYIIFGKKIIVIDRPTIKSDKIQKSTLSIGDAM